MLTEDRSTPVAALETDEEDTAFFLRRAEQAVEAAARATHPAAVQAHYRMSGIYLDLADGMQPAE
ncbi:hypothetical protein ACFOMD_09760 [Sphingoaurantiacus capsulatus]|uniref:Uncharacterized protein n=1 Tax=Sphingoaurantiacus capsulatus TaxID=1771310 RepID=A0ABV7XAL0_9SPHN